MIGADEGTVEVAVGAATATVETEQSDKVSAMAVKLRKKADITLTPIRNARFSSIRSYIPAVNDELGQILRLVARKLSLGQGVADGPPFSQLWLAACFPMKQAGKNSAGSCAVDINQGA
jgi:hypothetical protein